VYLLLEIAAVTTYNKERIEEYYKAKEESQS